MFTNHLLPGRVALVTGSLREIGRGIALTLTGADRVALFFCSNLAEMIVGEKVYMDGGCSILAGYFPALEHSIHFDMSLEARSHE